MKNYLYGVRREFTVSYSDVIGARVVVEGGAVSISPSEGFRRRIHEEATFQAQVIWDELTGETTDESNADGDPVKTEKWKTLCEEELRKAFGKDWESVKRSVMSLRFDPTLEHSWAAVGEAMRSSLQSHLRSRSLISHRSP